jgi:hypothetical protein
MRSLYQATKPADTAPWADAEQAYFFARFTRSGDETLPKGMHFDLDDTMGFLKCGSIF